MGLARRIHSKSFVGDPKNREPSALGEVRTLQRQQLKRYVAGHNAGQSRRDPSPQRRQSPFAPGKHHRGPTAASRPVR
jgi:hypothetical protein